MTTISKKKTLPFRLNMVSRKTESLFHLILGLFALACIIPFVFVIIISFSSEDSIRQIGYSFTPNAWAVDAYRQVFNLGDALWRSYFNSFFITIVICGANLFVCCCAAFVLSKCRFPGDKFINQVIVLALLFASNATWIMQFMVMAKLRMIDTYWALILPSISTSIGLYLMRQSMSTIHDAMVEAAKVDGASLFRICWQIVVPNSKPALMTLIIFAFQGAWNMQGGALIYSEELKTLPTVVQQISAAGLARQGVTFASSVVLLIPPLLVFLVAQGNVMETMANSGMKD